MTFIFPSLFFVFNGVARNIYPLVKNNKQKQLTYISDQDIQTLEANTRFNRKEIDQYLNTFSRRCPNGWMSFEKFESLYRRFYPKGRIRSFTKKAFVTLDKDKDGYLNFLEFMLAVDAMSAKNFKQKFDWLFCLSDTNKNGVIDPFELDSIQSKKLKPPFRKCRTVKSC
ncbi:hypothetical protein GJ496_000505 [Pomphorhynchus laevis]|nr:hypothetical protein GJ496_000505 [Pomphorhynchus laevis]